MKLKTFKCVIANICIVLIIVATSIAAFSSVYAALPASSAPIYRADSGNKVCLMVNVYWGDEYLDDMLDIFERNTLQNSYL